MPPRASVSPGHLAYLHGIGPAQLSGTNRILRIESKQVSYLILREVAAVDGIGGPIGKVGERGASRDRLPRLLGRVAEWQTRWLQVPVRATSWGFKSPLAHSSLVGAGATQRIADGADADGGDEASRQCDAASSVRVAPGCGNRPDASFAA